jgi:hypothetical protein
MKNPSRILLFFLPFFLNVTIALAQVKIEVKAFDGNTIFVFYHDKGQALQISAKGDVINVNMDLPSDFVIINQADFDKFAHQPELSQDRKSIRLVTKGKFDSSTIINGEKLTAIKFGVLQNKIPSFSYQDNIETALQNQDSGKDINSKLQQVKYSYSKGEHRLSFDIGSKNVGVAAFFRGKYLWLVFDQNRRFILAKNKIFTDFTQLEDNNSTILRIKVNGYDNARLVKNGLKCDLILATRKNKRGSILNAKNLPQEGGVIIKGNFVNNKIIEFHDPEIGDVIKVLPLRALNTRVTKIVETIDFNLVPTIQGIATILSSDEVQFILTNNALSIIPKHNSSPGTAEADTQQQKVGEIVSTERLVVNYSNDKSLLPILDKKLDIIDFNYNKSRLTFESSLAENSEQLFAKRFELAKFLFMHGFYHESLSALKLSKDTTAKEYNNNIQAQFLTAVCYTMTGFVQEAKNLYSLLLQNANDIQEISLWNNYNEFLTENNHKQLGLLNNLKLVNSYPHNIYWPMALAELDLSLLSSNLNTTELLLKNLRVEEDNFSNSLNYYKASYYRKQNKFDLAKQHLQELSLKVDDPFNMTRAEMDLTKLQLARKEITLKEAIARLDKLRFVWRGDKLEYDLLMLLANYYRDNHETIKACRMYQYIRNSFPRGINNFYITSEMAKIFNDAFLPKDGNNEIDDFTAVSLFYEFKDMNPIGAKGDEVILMIAKRLIKLDLLDKAIDLLKHQVMYRLTGEKRVVNADFLATILLMHKKPAAAIKILDETDKDNFKFDEHQYRRRLRARALIDLKKYNQALVHLKDDDSNDASILRKECLFRNRDWQQYIDVVEPSLSQIVDNKITDSMEQDIVRLGISYTMQNNLESLENLSKILDTINNNRLKNTIDLLLVNSNNINYADLDASLNVNQMQMILDKYKNQILDRK